MFRQKYQLIPSLDNDDQRILELDWFKGTPGHSQPRVIVLNAAFSL